jgi:hypothetical protein
VYERERSPDRPVASRAPESLVVVGGLTNAERLRLRRIEKREKEIERDTRKIKKVLDRSAPDRYVPRPEVKTPTYVDRVVPPVFAPRTEQAPAPQQQFEKSHEKQMYNTVEKVKAVEAAKQPAEAIEVALQHFEQNNNTLKEVEKREIIESILKTDTKEVDEHKEIAYELSHENKDMDKHSAAVWAAQQAHAEAQAHASARAIAAAQVAVSSQDQALKDIAKKQAKDALYKQAATGGFVAAVVIIAIIITILLIQSNK